MKTKIALISAVGIFLGAFAFAASMSLSPLNVSVKSGQTFSVLVSLDPQSGKISTAKVELKYPANLVEVTGFSFVGPSWIALAQEGYDLVDNTNGSMIKTAGYPKGASVPIAFGTATFRAKQSGIATISVGDKTLLLGADGKNSLSGAVAPVSVTITIPIPTPTPIPTLAGTVVSSTPKPIVQPTQSPEVTESVTPVPSVEPSAQQASILGTIGNKLDLGTDSWPVSLIVVLALVYGAYWLIKRKLRKQ